MFNLIISIYPSVFSSNFLYSFYYYDSFKNERGEDYDEKSLVIEHKLHNMYFSRIAFESILANEELKLIKQLVESSNSKVYLNLQKLLVNDLNEAVKVTELLSECKHLQESTYSLEWPKGLDKSLFAKTIKDATNMIVEKVFAAITLLISVYEDVK